MTDSSEVQKDKEIGTVKPEVATDRRTLLRRLLTVAGLAGVTGLLAGPLSGENLLPSVEATNFQLGTSNTATGATSLSASPGGVAALSITNTDTITDYDVGVYGEADGPAGIGIKGNSTNTTIDTGGVLGVLGVVEGASTGTILAE